MTILPFMKAGFRKREERIWVGVLRDSEGRIIKYMGPLADQFGERSAIEIPESSRAPLEVPVMWKLPGIYPMPGGAKLCVF